MSGLDSNGYNVSCSRAIERFRVWLLRLLICIIGSQNKCKLALNWPKGERWIHTPHSSSQTKIETHLLSRASIMMIMKNQREGDAASTWRIPWSVRFRTKADLEIKTWTVFALCVRRWRTMTTLLDLKSSVLRQVQRSQSLRTRRESPPTPSSPLAHRPEPLPRRWVAGMQAVPPTWHPVLFLPFFFYIS